MRSASESQPPPLAWTSNNRRCSASTFIATAPALRWSPEKRAALRGDCSYAANSSKKKSLSFQSEITCAFMFYCHCYVFLLFFIFSFCLGRACVRAYIPRLKTKEDHFIFRSEIIFGLVQPITPRDIQNLEGGF